MLSKEIRDIIKEVDKRDPESKKRRASYEIFFNLSLDIAKLRRSKGLSQRQLAKILKTSHPSIARWESPGYESYNLKKLVELADVLDHSIEIRFFPSQSFATSTVNALHTWANSTFKSIKAELVPTTLMSTNIELKGGTQ
ncbi:MAG: XRE family transcriptional regulator [Candidatus Nomurabacteria bacterium]|nr:MAG: XRE family transcriptional regulator [Candidatus Nomurabacteria bacterium]HRV75921.1 helix-turn-helix domain-containing protein [Candidatus Saccharimonadales bacterium]